jgi:hypothetical protein
MLRSNESLRGMLRECLHLELRKVKKGEEKGRICGATNVLWTKVLRTRVFDEGLRREFNNIVLTTRLQL